MFGHSDGRRFGGGVSTTEGAKWVSLTTLSRRLKETLFWCALRILSDGALCYGGALVPELFK